MEGKILGYEYQKGTPGYLKQGVKGNQVPAGAIPGIGGRGSFMMYGESPKVLVDVQTENGIETVDMYVPIKDNSGRRMSEKYVDSLMTDAVGKTFDSTSITRGILETVKDKLE